MTIKEAALYAGFVWNDEYTYLNHNETVGWHWSNNNYQYDRTFSKEIFNKYIEELKNDACTPSAAPPENKYDRVITGKNGVSSVVDVYDVLKAFNVTCPALQHLIKKALCVGIRGHKDTSTDLNDILESAKRAVELGNNEN